MLMTKKAPRMNAPRSVWVSRLTLDGLKTTAQKSVTTAWDTVLPPTVSVTTWKPAGVCIHELAIIIHTAEKMEPSDTMTVATKCGRADTRSQPTTSTARQPTSREQP